MHSMDCLPPLIEGRVHEVCGPAAIPFCLISASQKKGPVIFVDSLKSNEYIYPNGAGCFMDMARLVLVHGASSKEILWITEEALRSGCVPVVISRATGTLSLTAGRRLQLAAEAGQSLGLLIIQEGAGSNAAQTRWHCSPVASSNNRPVDRRAGSDSTLFHFSCKKNKTGTLGSWMVRWNAAARDIDCLSKSAGRHISQAKTNLEAIRTHSLRERRSTHLLPE